MTNITLPSVKSLLIKMRYDGQSISSGTGFIVEASGGPVLITNRHNVTGRDQNTGEPLSSSGGIPNEIVITHNRLDHLGEWVERVELLFDAESPRWVEHPSLGSDVDFVALPLKELNDVHVLAYDLVNTGPDIMVGPADSVSVVGFPFGLHGGGSLALWATGFMASEPDIDYKNLPVFLIDCRSRQGQSGSAVIAYRSGGMVAMKNGGSSAFSGPVTKFLGVYSGRINKESDLGIVWKASAILELTTTL